MSKYRTCTGCKFEGLPCGERDRMRDKTAGLGITSMKWKCDWRKPKFKPGDLVQVSIVTHYHGQDDEGRAHMSTDTFPGIFIQNAKVPSRAIVFIKPGTVGNGGDEEFYPSKDGIGFCRLPLSYIAGREGPPEHVCSHCQNPISILGHADHCDLGAPQEAQGFAMLLQ